MRDERRGGGAGTAPAAARTAPGTRPADPDSPDAPGDDPSGPSRPTPAPQHPQRPPASHPEDDSHAFATAPRTRRTRPSRPPPQPSRPTSSKPPLNNLPHRHDQNPADFRVSAGRSRDGPGPAQASPGLRNASPARRNPSALDSCEPASHNATPDDITNSTPSGLAPGSSRAGTRRVPGRVPDSPEQAPGPAGAAGAAGPLDSPGAGHRQMARPAQPRTTGPASPGARRRPHRARRARAPAMALGSTR